MPAPAPSLYPDADGRIWIDRWTWTYSPSGVGGPGRGLGDAARDAAALRAAERRSFFVRVHNGTWTGRRLPADSFESALALAPAYLLRQFGFSRPSSS